MTKNAREFGLESADRTGYESIGRPWNKAILKLFDLVLAASFIVTWAPCLLRSGTLVSSGISSHAFASFSASVPVGCLVCAALLLGCSILRKGRVAFGAPMLFIALFAYGAGFVLGAVLSFLDIGGTGAHAAGVAAGFGVVPLAVWWCEQARPTAFSRMLLCGSVVSLCVFSIIEVSVIVRPAAGVALQAVLALAVCVGIAVRALGSHAIGVAEPEGLSSDGSVEADGAPETLSARNVMAMLATSAASLVPFVLLSDAIPGVTVAGFTFNAATGLFLGAVSLLAVGLFAPHRAPLAPVLYWRVFPLMAGLLVVLDSFPKETLVSSLSAGLVFAFLPMWGVFAAVCLVHITAQREFPAAIVVGVPFALTSAVSLLAAWLSAFDLSVDEAGAMLRVVATIYFVFLMLAPASQLLRMSEGEAQRARGRSGDADGAGGLSFDDACEALADRYGLSAREREVFGYLVRGFTSPYIGKALFISDSTVRSHTKSIYRKFGVGTRVELIDAVHRSTLPS